MLRRFEQLKPQSKNPEFWLSHLLGGLHHLLLSADRTPPKRRPPRSGDWGHPRFPRGFQRLARRAGARLRRDGDANDGGRRLLITELAAALGARRHSRRRLSAAAAQASAALLAFDSNLARWLDMGTEQFAIGEDRSTSCCTISTRCAIPRPSCGATACGSGGNRGDLVRLASGWTECHAQLVDKLRGDHPAPDELVDAYSKEMARARDFVEQRKLAPIPRRRSA